LILNSEVEKSSSRIVVVERIVANHAASV